MFQLNIKFIFVLGSVLVFACADECNLKYATDFPDKESVLLWNTTSGFDIIEPVDDKIVLQKNEQISLACPGPRNTFKNVSSNIVLAKCVINQTLKINNKNYLLRDLGCVTSVTGEYMLSGDACGLTGIIKHIGHNIGDEFNIIIDICYDDEIGGTLYADHTIYGSAIQYSRSVTGRPSFKVGGLAPGISADNAYKQVNQKITFTNILGDSALADDYIYANSYLARGHLAPDADMVFVSSQFSTYFYINTVPQWQQINNGNWKSLETSLRRVAAKLGEDIQVYTGTHGVLALEDINGNPMEIYLSNDKLPVPKFVWKVFYSFQTRKGIAFVSVNNPFIKTVNANEYYLCDDICDEYSWGTASWKNPAKGLIYCCEIDDLRDTIQNIPQLEVDEIQDGNGRLKGVDGIMQMMLKLNA